MVARLSVLLAFMALVVVGAGCGGGGSSSAGMASNQPAGSPELDKAAFVEEAEATCSDYRAKVVPIKRELEAVERSPNPESPKNEARLGELLNDAIADAEVELRSIRELEPPQADEALIAKMLDTAQEGNGLTGEAAGALEEGDTSRFGDLEEEAEAVNAKAKAMAEGYGLKVCGQAP